MLHRARRLSVLLVAAPLAMSALTTGAAAHAAGPAAHLVSLAQAQAAMPAPSSMPGHPKTVVTTTAGQGLGVQPCLGPNTKPLTLKQSHQVASLYVDSPSAPAFMLTAVVFHTTAAAKTGLRAILHAERSCPSRQGDADGQVVRSLSSSYSAAGWTGWRSIDHLIIAADPADQIPATELRLNTEFLARGNVVLEVIETGPVSPGTGPAQDTARKVATRALLAGYANL